MSSESGPWGLGKLPPEAFHQLNLPKKSFRSFRLLLCHRLTEPYLDDKSSRFWLTFITKKLDFFLNSIFISFLPKKGAFLHIRRRFMQNLKKNYFSLNIRHIVFSVSGPVPSRSRQAYCLSSQGDDAGWAALLREQL